jgi:hypothetical protein
MSGASGLLKEFGTIHHSARNFTNGAEHPANETIEVEFGGHDDVDGVIIDYETRILQQECPHNVS